MVGRSHRIAHGGSITQESSWWVDHKGKLMVGRSHEVPLQTCYTHDACCQPNHQ